MVYFMYMHWQLQFDMDVRYIDRKDSDDMAKEAGYCLALHETEIK